MWGCSRGGFDLQIGFSRSTAGGQAEGRGVPLMTGIRRSGFAPTGFPRSYAGPRWAIGHGGAGELPAGGLGGAVQQGGRYQT
jgi:hypothetical protein